MQLKLTEYRQFSQTDIGKKIWYGSLLLFGKDVVLDLLKEAMLSKLETSKGYLIDGYPREVAQGIQFEEHIKPCALVIYFQVSDETMTQRLMGRGLTSGRADDNIETIRKRLDTFHKHSLPLVDHYGSKCKTVRSSYSHALFSYESPLPYNNQVERNPDEISVD